MSRPGAAEARLLIVDDNEDNRYTLLQRLKRHGYSNTAIAVNGREALDLIRVQDFDLVLLDVMMPELNGYEVLEQLKADERLRHIPVIMISAMDQLESVVRCIELGAEDYLAKPFNPTLLRARVGASLEKKRLRDEVAAHLAQIEADLASAREIQLDLVPHVFPEASDATPVEIFAVLQPARQVGGDLYDFFYLDPDTLCLIIADVSDKGATAALFMAHAKTVIHLVAGLLGSPGEGRPTPAAILSRANEELCRGNRAAMFVTAFLAILDVRSGRLLFSNAGHNVPYLIDRAGTLALLEGGRGKPLGISAKYSFTTSERTLAPGDCLFLFTDGITEAMDAGQELFENHRLEECLRETAGRPCAQMVEEVVRRVHSFAGTTAQADDITAMALRWLPAARETVGSERVVVIASRVADLPIVTRQIDELAAAYGWSGDLRADLQVVADEVLVNIMEYAYPVDEPGEIRISFGVSGHAIEMQFEDWGRPFDPLAVMEPDRTAPLKDREPGGVGIHFVRSLMSEVSYSRVDDKNRLLVRRRLQTGEKYVGSV